MRDDIETKMLKDFFNKFYFNLDNKENGERLKKGKEDIVIFPNEMYLRAIFGDHWQWHRDDNFYISKDSYAIDLFSSFVNERIQDNPEELIKHAFLYIKSSFSEKTDTYNNSFFGRIFNALDFLKIKYENISPEEIQRCLIEVQKRAIPNYIYYELYRNKIEALDSIKNWRESFRIACEEAPSEELYEDLLMPFDDICSELGDIVNCQSHDINCLLNKINELEQIISELRIKVAKPENINWRYDSMSDTFLKNIFCPHYELELIIHDGLYSFVPKKPYVFLEENEIIDGISYGDYNRIKYDFIRTLCSGKYDEFLTWDGEKASEIYDFHMSYFYELLILDLNIFIKYLQKYDSISKKENYSEFWQLFGFLITTINESLSKKEQNEPVLSLHKDEKE